MTNAPMNPDSREFVLSTRIESVWISPRFEMGRTFDINYIKEYTFNQLALKSLRGFRGINSHRCYE